MRLGGRSLANLTSQRHVNFTNATSDELEQLAQACEPATFGRNDETIVRDGLLDGTDSLRKLKVELYKLNFYEPKLPPRRRRILQAARRYPARRKDVRVARPCLSDAARGWGSARQASRDRMDFDSAAELSTAPPSSIGYAAFFSDVEHEVAPVLSGHRITLTYNLYFDDDGLASVSEPLTAPSLQTEMERNICAAFEALLENTLFLPDGGILGFGLRHVYQFKEDIKHVYDLFKGSDAALYRAVRSLGLEPVLHLYYEQDGDAGLIDHVLDFNSGDEFWNPVEFVHSQGGIAIRLETDDITPVDWVTPVTTFNCRSSTFVAFGNEASLELAYGHLCLIVHIGKVGQRTVKKVWEDAWEWLPD
ncbi:hypothetical protein BC826DRAFT_1104606 [Russula brevipes]|nr:hypothetical protein BC826DRAFT_1104606 [Russula brevipes]